MFRASTSEQLRRRVDFYIDLVKALGLSLEENGLGEVLEDYRLRLRERSEAMAGKCDAEDARRESR